MFEQLTVDFLNFISRFVLD